MPTLKIGRNHFNTDHIVNVVTPSTEGQKKDVARVTLLGEAQDVILYDEDADAMREWLETQAPAKHAPVVTKDESKSPAPLVTKSPTKPA